MNRDLYTLIHLVGIFALFLACGGLLTTNEKKNSWTAPVHGTALIFIFVSGFGLLSRLGIHGTLPPWAMGKLFIWVLFGLSLVAARKKWLPIPLLFSLWIVFGGTAASLALWKPS